MYCVSFLFSKLQIYSLHVASGFEVKHNYGLFMGNSDPQNVTFKEKLKKFATGKGAGGFVSVVV